MKKYKKVKKYNTLLSVKLSLLTLYLALTFPIPFFTIHNLKTISIFSFIVGILLIISLTNDYVLISDLSFSYKTSIISNLLGKKNWEIAWEDILNIKTFPTSQGSKVHYFVNNNGESFLIPQRIEKFDEFKKIIETKTNLKNNFVVIAPLWTYKILTTLSITLWVGEIIFIFLKGYQY